MKLWLYKLAFNLKQKGLEKVSQKVLDLASKRRDLDLRKKHNQKILDRLRQEDKLYSIEQQHQEDIAQLQSKTPSSELGLDVDDQRQPSRRYEVQVRYPSFDQNGKPYFDSSSVEEFLILTEQELEQHKQQQQKGYLQIKEVRKLLPKSKTK